MSELIKTIPMDEEVTTTPVEENLTGETEHIEEVGTEEEGKASTGLDEEGKELTEETESKEKEVKTEKVTDEPSTDLVEDGKSKETLTGETDSKTEEIEPKGDIKTEQGKELSGETESTETAKTEEGKSEKEAKTDTEGKEQPSTEKGEVEEEKSKETKKESSTEEGEKSETEKGKTSTEEGDIKHDVEEEKPKKETEGDTTKKETPTEKPVTDPEEIPVHGVEDVDTEGTSDADKPPVVIPKEVIKPSTLTPAIITKPEEPKKEEKKEEPKKEEKKEEHKSEEHKEKEPPIHITRPEDNPNYLYRKLDKDDPNGLHVPAIVMQEVKVDIDDVFKCGLITEEQLSPRDPEITSIEQNEIWTEEWLEMADTERCCEGYRLQHNKKIHRLYMKDLRLVPKYKLYDINMENTPELKNIIAYAERIIRGGINVEDPFYKIEEIYNKEDKVVLDVRPIPELAILEHLYLPCEWYIFFSVTQKDGKIGYILYDQYLNIMTEEEAQMKYQQQYDHFVEAFKERYCK